MSTSQSNRFFKIAAGIAVVTLVAWAAMNLGSSDSADSSASSSASVNEAPRQASKPNFEVKPHSAKLGSSGVEGEAEAEAEGTEEGGIRQTTGPSRMMLKMATDPVVNPESARAEVEAVVAALLPGVERCWQAEERQVEAQWRVALEQTSGNGTLRLKGGPVFGAVDHRLTRCLTEVTSATDMPEVNGDFTAHWPFVFNSDGTVEM
jgi:hypothetical protein